MTQSAVPFDGRSIKTSSMHKYTFFAIIFVALSAVSFGLFLHGLGKASNLTDMENLLILENSDFTPVDSWDPMMAAMEWLQEHPEKNVYDGVFFERHIKFQYPLTSLLPMEALDSLGVLNLAVFSRINLVLMLATAVGMALLMIELAKRLELPGAGDDWFTQLGLGSLGFVSTLCFYPVLKAFSLGQVQVWLNAAFVFSCIFFLRDRRLLAGMLLGASSLIKPQMSLFLLWALIRKDWRLATGWASIVIPGTALATALYGYDQMVSYLDVLSFIGQHGESYHVNQTVNGLVNRLLHNGSNLEWMAGEFAPYHPVVRAATFLSGVAFVAFGLLWRRGGRTEDQITSFIVAAVCFTVSSPVAWVHHYGVLLPAFGLAFLRLVAAGARRPAGGFALLAIAMFLAGNLLFWPVNLLSETPFNILQSYLFLATLLLLGQLLLLPDERDPQAVRFFPRGGMETVQRVRLQAPDGEGVVAMDDARQDAAGEPPLYVDLDGTLIRTNLLLESALSLVKARPWMLFLVPAWLLGGRAHLKASIARRVELDPAMLVYNDAVLERLAAERSRGRSLILATAADRRYAEAVAAHVGLFDGVLASDADTNLKSERKRDAILAHSPSGLYDYMGNDAADLVIWRSARKSVAVDAPARVVRAARENGLVETISTPRKSRVLLVLRAMRIHQWLKNLLVFVPLIASHRLTETGLDLQALGAFLAFGLCASSIYVLNDLLDLPADRIHPRKRRRPFASGDLPLGHGLVLFPALITASAVMAAVLLPPLFLGVLATYAGCSLFYNLFGKERVIWDVMLLAGLYSLRVLAGAAATMIVPSFWLLAFSMFLFLSLAMVKRYAEMDTVLKLGRETARGRGYLTEDMPVLQSIGVSSGFLAVLVIALYINSPEVGMQYTHPQALWIICPLLLFWMGRIWLQTHRGLMHDDPIVFAVRDRWSIAICLVSCVALALGNISSV